MSTINKLVEIKEYDDIQTVINKERLNKTIAELDMNLLKVIDKQEEWKQIREEIKRKKEIEMKTRELYHKNRFNKRNIQKYNDNKNKEIQKKVLEHRQRLQKMYDERISRQRNF